MTILVNDPRLSLRGLRGVRHQIDLQNDIHHEGVKCLGIFIFNFDRNIVYLNLIENITKYPLVIKFPHFKFFVFWAQYTGLANKSVSLPNHTYLQFVAETIWSIITRANGSYIFHSKTNLKCSLGLTLLGAYFTAVLQGALPNAFYLRKSKSKSRTLT